MTTPIDYTTANPLQGSPNYDVVLDTMSFRHEEETLDPANQVVNKTHGAYLNILGSDWALGADGKEHGNGPTTFLNFGLYKVLGWADTWCGWFPWFCSHESGSQQYELIAVDPDGPLLQQVLDMAATGRVHAVIDRVFPLSQGAAALDYLAEGHARGKVVINVAQQKTNEQEHSEQ